MFSSLVAGGVSSLTVNGRRLSRAFIYIGTQNMLWCTPTERAARCIRGCLLKRVEVERM